MPDQPLFETAAVGDLATTARHLASALDLAQRESKDGTIAALAQLTSATTAANSAEIHLVREARRHQVTWHEIAAALGVTRQAAAARFRPQGIT